MKNMQRYARPKAIRRSKTSDFTLSRSVKRRWLKALRSGKYKQGPGTCMTP